ncbi:MAG TPA: flagellar basal body-associated FliL family protein [Verrucomicrobiae bacterium]|nr:flagellar basal body-associated FliL family protein [Verrucomicrobiae bacterium]
MSDKKADPAKPEGEGAKAAGNDAQGGSGGFKAWLPLILSLVLMPILAAGTTRFLILPKVVQARGSTHGEAADAKGDEEHADAKPADEHGTKESGKPKDGKTHGGGSKKQSVQISKVIVNVAGSMGSRYLMTSFTLAGNHKDFRNVIEENKDQLLDLASTAMASKTISELEKPGARNQLRAELISIFNNALGGNLVQEIYFTEFAVQ